MFRRKLSIICVGIMGAALLGCGSGKKPVEPGFELMNSTEGCTFFMSINNEPVYWGSGRAVAAFRGFPVKQGTNIFHVRSEFPANYKDPILSKPLLTMMAIVLDVDREPVQTSDWEEVDSLSEWGPFSEPYDWDSDFEITNARTANKGTFDKLGEERSALTLEAQKLGFRLAKLAQDKDPNKLAKALGYLDDTAAKIVYPTWLAPNSTNVILVSGATNESDIVCETGDYFVLAHSGPGKHLSSLVRGNNAGRVDVDCFLFARREGKWSVKNNNGEWRPVDLK